MKSKRQEKILELIEKYNIETQEELIARLAECGIESKQTTVSRDIKELRLIKVLTAEGRYKYATAERAEADLQERFIQMFANCVLSVASAGNLIVIKTITGSASAAGEAIDSLRWPEILGTIAGDNTVFIAIHDERAAQEVVRKFKKMMK